MKLNHRVVGQGPPLLILHGLLGCSDNWAPHAQRLAAHFQVVTVDLRNHGRSPHATAFDYDVMAADLTELVGDLKLGAVHLLGHSMGGKVAMRFAQLHPTRVNKLVVADMTPRAYPPRHDQIFAAMAGLELSRFRQRPEVDAALAAVAPEAKLRQFLLKNLGRDESGALAWKPNLGVLRTAYPDLCRALPTGPRFAGPTLFLRGGRSDYVRDEDLALIYQMFPAATLTTLPTAGHWLHADAADEFLELVESFLSDAGPA